MTNGATNNYNIINVYLYTIKYKQKTKYHIVLFNTIQNIYKIYTNYTTKNKQKIILNKTPTKTFSKNTQMKTKIIIFIKHIKNKDPLHKHFKHTNFPQKHTYTNTNKQYTTKHETIRILHKRIYQTNSQTNLISRHKKYQHIPKRIQHHLSQYKQPSNKKHPIKHQTVSAYRPRHKTKNIIKTSNKSTHTPPNHITITPTRCITNLTIYKTKIRTTNETNTQYQFINKRKPNKTHKNYTYTHLTSICLTNIKLLTLIPISYQKTNKPQTLNPYQNPKHHPKPCLKTQPHPNIKYVIIPKHKMALAPWPCHKTYINHPTNTEEPEETINYITKHNIHTHLLPILLENINPALQNDTHLKYIISQSHSQYTSQARYNYHTKHKLYPTNKEACRPIFLVFHSHFKNKCE